MCPYRSSLIAALVALSSPAFAQEDAAPALTISSNGTLISDYRFRGVSQTDEQLAIQAGVTATHTSGFYVSAWASNLSGWGTFGGANVELDLIGGFRSALKEGAAVDLGLTWYTYPGGANNSDFAEPYLKLSDNVGPVALVAGVAYAPKQEALGNYSATSQSRGQKQDNLYTWVDAAAPIARSPVTLKGHIGHSNGNPGLGPNGTSVTPTGEYFDWLVGIDTTWKSLTVGIAYIDTDISRRDAARLQPGFSRHGDGITSIADATIVFSLGAVF